MLRITTNMLHQHGGVVNGVQSTLMAAIVFEVKREVKSYTGIYPGILLNFMYIKSPPSLEGFICFYFVISSIRT
jgi:hypothetical protein